MWLKTFLGLIAFVMFPSFLAAAALDSTAPDPFLDRAIPPPAKVTSYLYIDHIRAMQAVVGKPMIFPIGFLDFLAKTKPYSPGLLQTAAEVALDEKETTLRKYLKTRERELLFTINYDAARGAMLVDFSWRRPVTHSGRELVDLLVENAPTPMTQLDYGSKSKDAWRMAFDEMISRPENYAKGWKLRLGQDLANGSFSFGNFIGDAVVVGQLHDNAGQSHLLVLADCRPMAFPGPDPLVTYYLFDADGKLEDGGYFEAGSIWSLPTVKFEPGKKRAVLETVFHPLVFTETATGKKTTLQSSFHTGDTWDYILQVKDGKLAASLYMNGRLLALPRDYMTPLRHLTD
jgi:hypothetical protein